MKFTLDRRELAETLKWVAAALDKRPSSPVMGGIRVVVTDDTVTFSAWNYSAAHTARLSVLAADPGEALIPGASLAFVVGNMSSPDVTVELAKADTEAEITGGSSRFTLRTLPLGDYMAAPALSDPIGYVSGGGLAEVVKATEWAAPDDDTIADLLQVRLDAADGQLTLVASDRFVFAVDSIGYDGQPFGAGLVPAMLTAAVAGLAGEQTVGIGFDGGLVSLHGNDRTVSLRTVDQEFMKGRSWQPVVDGVPTPNVMTAATRELADAVKRVGALADDNGAITIKGAGSDLEITVEGQKGSALDVVTVDGAVDGFDAGFNPKFLGNALRVFDGPISIGYSDPAKPLKITSETLPNRIAIVMPRRVKA